MEAIAMPAKKSTGTKTTAKKASAKKKSTTTKKRVTTAAKSSTAKKTKATASKASTKPKTSTAKKPKSNGNGKNKIAIDPNIRQQMIAEAAYYIAESRGFTGGTPENDWIKAESQIDQLLHQQ